ncbi:hypothetical protein [Halarcobacter sp.]|uniref:hypothetical protein n=1 Tax=Halarcobacter sp. TaxID=2321133 RepID=UPI002AAC4A6C|nr:hypothetical protein [Halarcobacter sp.]
MKANCNVISGALQKNNRKDKIIVKALNDIEIVYSNNDTLEEFEYCLNQICGNSSSLFKLKKKISAYFLSVVSVIVILFALLSSSLYEDIMKKIIFETPFDWLITDTVSIFFVLIFFLGLVLMPSILDGEGSEFKQSLKAWINKDIRILKRLKIAVNSLDKKCQIDIYNIDLIDDNHWIWRLVMPIFINHFININIYVRNDLKNKTEKRLKKLDVLNITTQRQSNYKDTSFLNYELFFSQKEQSLYKLMQLSSTNILNKDEQNIYISLELFEYCGRNFFDTRSEKNQLISGFQNFINRCFDDFKLLEQHASNQIFFKKHINLIDIEDDKRRLSFYLRNHIEECLNYFDNPISLLILYYYVKDIVLDEKRTIIILEKLIDSIKNKQQYDLINNYWFDIAGYMFDSKNLESFISSNDSIYRKLSIKTLNSLIFLFERNGKFEQALLIAKYLYEINPNKYSIDISSLYERMGEYDNAFNTLSYNVKKNIKPNEVEVRFYQRKAWIIVSQRKIEKKEEGLNSLEKLKELLFSHQEFNEPIWLWHYYNIKANYEEWNENFDLAIENYMKCLKVPTLGAFEYGATFINMSIAYRFKFLENKDEKSINQSIYLGELGVKLKDSVGDKDEMPVVLHNQALNILYKLAFYDDDSLLDKVLNLSSKSLKILETTNSKKRLGMALTEAIITNLIKGKDSILLIKKLELHWVSMDIYEKEQALKIYELFINRKLVEKFEWMIL